MNKPLFSVVIPTYNHAHLLGEAIESVINQTFSDWEIIIVNDGSTDNTKEVLDYYSQNDSRIKYFHKENGGTASALNYGIEKANGVWISWLSSDDMFVEDKLEIMSQAINDNPEIKFFYSHYYYFNDETKEKTLPNLWQPIPNDLFQVTKFFVGNYIHGVSLVIHKSVFQKVGKFDETMRQAQDFDMWLRITSKYKSKYIDRRTCITRFHPGQDTNIFPEGMYYDSARSCLNFINTHKYEDFYPLLDLRKPEHAKFAIDDTIKVGLTTNAFMYQCSNTPAFFYRFFEWVFNNLNKSSQQSVKDFIAKVIKELPDNFPKELIESLIEFKSLENFQYKKFNYYDETTKYIDSLINEGDQHKASRLDRYLQILFTKRETQNLEFVKKHITYKPKLFVDEKESNFSLLPYGLLKKIELKPITFAGKFEYKIEIECPNCKNKFNVKDDYNAKSEVQEINFVCGNCLSSYKINDSEINKHLVEISPKEKSKVPDNNKIAFIARGLKGKSGGTMIFVKYMEWLDQLGFDITIFSDTCKGTWTEFPGKFTETNNYEEIDLSNFSYVFLYSILDLGKIVTKIDLERIVYVSQAYEGFLYGETYELLREDKSLFHSLHSLPINIITVSDHLYNFFRANFNNKNVFLVRNFINLKNFISSKNIIKNSNTILFVGNPIQPLKGLDFLASAIKLIQNSNERIDDLKLIMAVGTTTKQIIEGAENIKNIIDCNVDFFYNLNSEQMKELVSSSSVYVCCSWYEGFSLSVLEAMAASTPVISTKNMGAESFCVHNYNSFLVDYGNVNSLVNLLLGTLKNNFSKEIIKNAIKTAKDYSELNSKKLFIEMLKQLDLKIDNTYHKNDDIEDNDKPEHHLFNEEIENSSFNLKLTITYLISNVKSNSGGNQTLLNQINYLASLGHKINVVSYSDAPNWIKLKAKVIKISHAVPIPKYVPESDIVIATYYSNAIELEKIKAKLKIYFAQGDQYIFEDEKISESVKIYNVLKEQKNNSLKSYNLKDVKLILNSDSFAQLVFNKTGVKADGIVNVGIDKKIFRPIDRQLEGFKKRILLVGPDILGEVIEPLHFKGITEAKEAFLKLQKEYDDFTIVRISNTKPEIFKDVNCEFYMNPTDELKTFLFGTADILIYPSYYESWGLPPLEAMASKTAVICTRNSGSENYCVDKQNAILINPKSSDEIYSAVKMLFENKDLNEKIVNGGYLTSLKYTKEYEWNTFYKILISLYNETNDIKNDFEEVNEGYYQNQIIKAEELINISNLENATEILESIIKKNPKYIDALNDLSVVKILQNNFEEALKLIDEVIKIDSKNEIALENIKYIESILSESIQDIN